MTTHQEVLGGAITDLTVKETDITPLAPWSKSGPQQVTIQFTNGLTVSLAVYAYTVKRMDGTGVSWPVPEVLP